MVSGTSLKNVGTVTRPRVTLQGLSQDTTYRFAVAAVSGSTVGPISSLVSVHPIVVTLSKPTLTLKSVSSGKVTLSWNKVTNATRYYVYRKVKGGSYKKVKTVTGTGVTLSGLTNGTTYYFKVRPVRVVDGKAYKGTASAAVKATPKASSASTSTSSTGSNVIAGVDYGSTATWYKSVIYDNITSVDKIHSIYFNATTNKDLTAQLTTGTGTVSVPSGTSVLVTVKVYTYAKNNICRLPSGKYVYINGADLTYTGTVTSSKDLSSTLKTQFVNKGGYSSDTEYLVWVSLYFQKMYIFKGSQGSWKLLKTFSCATGAYNSPTPAKTTKLWKKAERVEFSSSTYGVWATWFTSNIIHSIPYLTESETPNGDGSWYLGQLAVSAGCIRLSTADAKYIYDEIPLQTTIVTY